MNRRILILLSAVLLCGIGAVVWFWWPGSGGGSKDAKTKTPQSPFVPQIASHDGYVSSRACRECHAEQFTSWHRTYHRSMTQLASPESVVAPFDGRELIFEGRLSRVERRQDEFWVDMIDPIWTRQTIASGADPMATKDPPRKQAQVVMTTGSHHRQSYWVTTKDPQRKTEVFQFPWTYQIDAKKWIPLDAAFLQPLKPKRMYSVWNESCISCHSVAGKPGLNHRSRTLRTSVAEFGIACESCHGPGQAHVEHYRKHRDQPPENETIINPAHVDHRVASHICGNCHSVSQSRDLDRWWTDGRSFRPGQDLEVVRKIVKLNDLPSNAHVRGSFWNDGSSRTGGREFNAMALTGCYQKGKMGCISCHSMHRSDPDHLLAEGMGTNKSCTGCHDTIARDVPAHTHHAADSSGSQCYNCHMPHTSYALLSVIRSHRIDSPRTSQDVMFGKPNACNLCHLDQTLQWTDNHLVKWYKQPPTRLNEQQKTVAASLLHLLGGDAGQRVVMAGNYGLAAARKVSGEAWMAPHLAALLEDPYPAVRWLAYESLKQQEAYKSLSFDYVGQPAHLAKTRAAVFQQWNGLAGKRIEPRLLVSPTGSLRDAAIQQLIQSRDPRNTYIAE